MEEEDLEVELEELSSQVCIDIDEDALKLDYDSKEPVKNSSFIEVVNESCGSDAMSRVMRENVVLKLKLKFENEESIKSESKLRKELVDLQRDY